MDQRVNESIQVPDEHPFPDDAGVAYIDGEFMPIAEAKIPVTDFGFSRSDVTYDVVHVWNGQFFRLDDHIDRFAASVAGTRLTLPFGTDILRETLLEVVARSGLREAYVDMILTRGVPPRGCRDLRLCTNHSLILYAVPFVWVVPREKIASGGHMIISDIPRIPKESVNSKYKNFHWGDFTQSLFDAYEKGGDTTVLPDADGNITEGPGFNVFMIREGAVFTGPDNVLEGITRRTVLELCAEIGVETRVQTFKADDMRAADEIFISSTAGGIMPITKIDHTILGNGVPGPLTTRLFNLYWANKLSGWHGTPVNYD
ncbi:MAG TPA: branched-chain amino acid--2-keto-4-methylthiobutyrate aminotransferase [Sneathiellales bacterium]|nr:branched-chain amino acid--2-keto-4-methylthiobutyrate aminotransferase [Sneathiellales bacterium]